MVGVRRVERVGTRLVRVTLGGAELAGMPEPEPAASVRLLLPAPGESDIELPAWNGNEFLLADGRRPPIRTFTPRRFDAGARELDVDVVLHGSGTASTWAEHATPGSPVAVSGPGRGYEVDRDAPAFFLGGDETAIPAIGQLLEVMRQDRPVAVAIEIADADGRVTLPEHPTATVAWHTAEPGATPGDALLAAVRATTLAPGTRVWIAGEAAAVQRIRKHLFEERKVPRAETVVRGYWKAGRAGS
jgi:NADPH-dependent ferric siderophore reductase